MKGSRAQKGSIRMVLVTCHHIPVFVAYMCRIIVGVCAYIFFLSVSCLGLTLYECSHRYVWTIIYYTIFKSLQSMKQILF